MENILDLGVSVKKSLAVFVSLIWFLTLVGCAGKMPPPVYTLQPKIEKTPREKIETAQATVQRQEKVENQKQKKDQAVAALKDLTQDIAIARQNKVDKLSKYNFEKVLSLHKEALDNQDAELFEEAMYLSTKAQEALALAYQDAEIQKKQRSLTTQEQKESLEAAQTELARKRRAAEQQAAAIIKQAVAAVNQLEEKMGPERFAETGKELRPQLEEAFKLLKKEDFAAATTAAQEVLNSCEEITGQAKSAPLPPATAVEENSELWQRIQQYLAAADFGNAYFQTNRYLNAYPQTIHYAEALFIIGRCFEAFDSHAQALSSYALLLDKFPQSQWTAPAIIHSSLVYTKINNYKLASQQIQKLAASPLAAANQDSLLYATGKLEQAQEHYDIALPSFQKLLADFPQSQWRADTLLAVGACYQALGQETKGREAYWQLYRQYPTSGAKKTVSELLSKQIYEEARELTKEGEYPQARDKYHQLIQDFADSSLLDNATYWLGETYYAEGNYQSALQLFHEVLNNDSLNYTDPGYLKDDDSLLKIGYCYYNLKKYDKAHQAFTNLLENYPQTEFKADATYWLKLLENLKH